MRVLELWRYPVKSLQGERLDLADLDAAGIEGDRRWALFDLGTGLGLTARRVPDLLFAAVALRAAADVSGARCYEAPDDNLTDDGTGASGRWHPWEGADGGAFHDNPDARLSPARSPAGSGATPRCSRPSTARAAASWPSPRGCSRRAPVRTGDVLESV